MSVNWIKSERLKREISQAKLAKVLNVVQAKLSEWETHKKPIPSSIEQEIKEFFLKYDSISDEEKGKLITRRKYSQIRYDVHTAKSKQNKGKSTNGTKKALPLNSYKKAPNTLTGIALFAGCGGLSLGFKNAGVRVLGHAELQEDIQKTYQDNFKDSIPLGNDVRDISNNEVKEWKKHFGEVDFLFGGPPCQGFSLAGKRDVFDPRNELYLEFARIASELKPKIVVLENVRLLTSMKTIYGDLVADDIVKRFDEAGYRMTYQVLNAKNYGVPQSRERVIFIGIRKDFSNRPIVFPIPTHGEKGLQASLFGLDQYKTFKDATGDLEKLESGESSKTDELHFAIKHPEHVIKMLKATPEGKSAHENEDPNLRPKSGFNTTYKRLRWDEPCSTISTNFSMISGSRNVHPSNTRSLTIREAARCQTFPDSFKFSGKWGVIRTMIGNSVPPRLAEVLANHLIEEFMTEPQVKQQPQSEVYKNILLQD